MTLDRVLSRHGLASRGDARRAISAGRMRVNGRVVRDPDMWVQPDRDTFALDDRSLQPARRLYLLFYKPKGVITSHGDPGARKTVYDYLERRIGWVSPVGRLDMDSSGLLLLSNDTEFAHYIMDPESRVLKTYLVKVSGIMTPEILASLQEGVQLKRGDWARPTSVRHLDDRSGRSRIEVVLSEGRNREIRRMVEAVGFKVLKLVRTRIGHLDLEGLQVGQWRTLTRAEVSRFGAFRAEPMPPKRRRPRLRRGDS